MNREAITVLERHKAHWKRLLEEKICDKTEGKETIEALDVAISALSTEREKGTKYYRVDDVIKVLLDNGYGDEENGADPEYMTALHDVYRGLENISVFAVPERETGKWIYCGNSEINGLKICECTKCHKRNYGSHNFCPNCGAYIREED